MKKSQKIVATTALSSILALGVALSSTAAIATEKRSVTALPRPATMIAQPIHSPV